MKLPIWLQPALIGAVAGAIVIAFLGFTQLGWVTGSSAASLATKQADLAVVTALMPYCLQNSANDPVGATVLTELKAASTYNRRAIVEKAGWATPLGATAPNTALAQACQTELSKG
jgi:hypothetical protein